MGYTKDERKKFRPRFTCHEEENDVLQKFSQKGCDNEELHAELSNPILMLQIQAFPSQKYTSKLLPATTPRMSKELFLLNYIDKNKSQTLPKAYSQTRFTNMLLWLYVTPVIQDSHETRLTNVKLLRVTRDVQSS